MKRRTVLRQASLGAVTVGTVSIAGCGGDDNGGNGNDPSEPLPELSISSQTLNSTVDELVIAGYQNGLRRGQQHEDIHFAVTLSIRNEGNQRVDLADYGYRITLYDDSGSEITPGDTWSQDEDTIAPGETGQVLVQVSFIDSEGTPEDIDRYRVVMGCGQGSGAYC